MSTSLRSLSGMACIALLARPCQAQIEIPRASEIIEVRVTNLDVVVIDRAGNHVHGLTREDFEVEEEGKRQEITNLSEMIGPPAAAGSNSGAGPAIHGSRASVTDQPPRHIVIFFDNASTTNAERQRFLPAIVELVGELRSVDEAMIVSWNRRLKIVVPPTHDRTVLEAGLQRVVREMSLGGAPQLTMFDDLAASGGTRAERTMSARRRVREATSDLTESVRGLNAILARLAGVDGRKVLLLFSGAFSARPGSENTDPGEEDSLLAMEDVHAPTLLQSVTRAANAAGVTIYAMHARGLDSGMSAADSSPQQSLGRLQASDNSISGLAYLANQTGGFLTANMNGFRRAVERVSSDLSNYYSIGYRQSVVRRDSERSVLVRTRDRNYTVRARRTFVERSFETEITDKVITSLLFPGSPNDLGISASIAKTSRGGRNRLKIPVDVKIPMHALTFAPDGDDVVADLTIFIASGESSGNISSVAHFRQLVKVKRGRLASLGGKHYTYGMDVDLRTGSAENRLSIAVLDNLSKANGFVSVDVNPPAKAARR